MHLILFIKCTNIYETQAPNAKNTRLRFDVFNRRDYCDLSCPQSKPKVSILYFISHAKSFSHLAPEHWAAGHAAVLLYSVAAVSGWLLAADTPELLRVMCTLCLSLCIHLTVVPHCWRGLCSHTSLVLGLQLAPWPGSCSTSWQVSSGTRSHCLLDTS